MFVINKYILNILNKNISLQLTKCDKCVINVFEKNWNQNYNIFIADIKGF